MYGRNVVPPPSEYPIEKEKRSSVSCHIMKKKLPHDIRTERKRKYLDLPLLLCGYMSMRASFLMKETIRGRYYV